MRGVVFAALCAGLWALPGCGSTGEQRFRVSGKVTFDGKPIPYGDVLITPDGEKKNSGPQGIANIRDGQYDTAAAGGKGFGGGPAVIRVTGFDREGGKLLCEQEFKVELPRADAAHDITVPPTKDKEKPKTQPSPEI
ncbi:MAG: DUF4198 domain-containing protein [Planctomycetes bacterium]|nr:DUF4198 domain-containing protein [Planctomycetota bacterium]